MSEETHPEHKYSVTFVTKVATTRLFVYQGKVLNFATVPYFISKFFREKKTSKTYTFRTKSKCKILSRTKLIRYQLASLNSICNDFVMRDNSPRINISRCALSIMNKLFKTRLILSRTWQVWQFSDSQNFIKNNWR